MSKLTFRNLVEFKADEWNNQVALEYGVDIEELKDIITRRDLRLIENRIQHHVTKDEIELLASHKKTEDELNISLFKDGDTSVVYQSTVIDMFVISITNTEGIVDSIAITGKIIIGANFNKSNLSNSYFCGCTFYKCDLNEIDFGNSVFVACDFISCSMSSIDFNGSTISRSHFYECNINDATFDYVALSDCMLVECDLHNSKFIQSRILFTGFNDSELYKVDWKDSDIVQSTYTNCNCVDSDFKRTVLIDSILLRVNFIGCDLNSLSVTCITISECQYDDKYNHLFEMEHLLYSPSIFEWDNDSDNFTDFESDGVNFL